MKVSKRADHTLGSFWRRTIGAQIHVLALVLAGLGMVLLLPKALAAGPLHFWACLVFLVTGSMVFLVSSVYHFCHDGYQTSERLQLLFEDLDHYCIYLFIAGTYTPFLLNSVAPPWRGALIVAAWTIAISGIVYTRFRSHLIPALQSRGVYTSLFVLMGLLFFLRIGEIWSSLSTLRFSLLIGGMLSYLLGAIGYATQRPKLFHGFFGYHELWHVMVLMGAVFHFCFIYSFY